MKGPESTRGVIAAQRDRVKPARRLFAIFAAIRAVLPTTAGSFSATGVYWPEPVCSGIFMTQWRA